MWSYITEPEDVDDDSEGFQEAEAQPTETEDPPQSDVAAGDGLPGLSNAAPGKASKLPHQAYDMHKRCDLHKPVAR